MLDIGSGWGAFAIHAAREHGAQVTGITLSEPQAAGARERAEAAGVGDRWSSACRTTASCGRALRRARQHRDGRARGRRADRRVRPPAGRAARPGRAAAQPRHRPAAPLRPRGGPVLRALRVPRRRPAAPLAHHARAGARRLPAQPRGGLPRGLRRDAAPLGAAPRREPRRGRAAGRARSARASGGSTCARRATGSRPASRRSTRCSARRPSGSSRSAQRSPPATILPLRVPGAQAAPKWPSAL